MEKETTQFVWRDRKRNVFGLPWTFTVYSLAERKLLIESGFLNKKEEEIRLYRIMDVTLNRTLMERLVGTGTIHCCSADKSTPEFDIVHIRDAARVKDLLSDMIEAERNARRVGMREFMDTEEEGE